LTPNVKPAAINELIDRWRPETYMFHLRTGEIDVTLKDVSMILALPIDGPPVCMSTDSKGWRGKMQDLIGVVPSTEDGPYKIKSPSWCHIYLD
jgi:hypothetical protein